MKILVTGATGFIGSHLCELLLQDGHELFCLVRDEKKLADLKLAVTAVPGKLSFKKSNEWVKTLPAKLDVVIHLAGMAHSFDVKDYYNVNARATEQLILDLQVIYPKLTFCLISSLAAVGPASSVFNKLEEDTLPHPVSHYGHSKHLAETILKEKAPAAWKKIIIRPPMVIGPRDPAFLDVFKMVKSGYILYPGLKGAESQFSFVCVFDLINVIQKAITSAIKITDTEFFFAAFPKPVEYREIIQNIKALLGKQNVKEFSIPKIFLGLAAVINTLIHRFRPAMNFRLTIDKYFELRHSNWICHSIKSSEDLQMNYEWDLEKTLKACYLDYQNRGWI